MRPSEQSLLDSKRILQSNEASVGQKRCFVKGWTVMQLKIILTSPLYPAYRARGYNEKPQVSYLRGAI
jgi:hypothetical protein